MLENVIMFAKFFIVVKKDSEQLALSERGMDSTEDFAGKPLIGHFTIDKGAR